ncbi:MAG: tRNA 2-thiocytidine(32) synthetase TtcA [Alcaligenaceae bacterium]|nr:tRNA 2-thiocytidine(32) synthetase TtcA [Alcaligenaceae bacterium]
MSQSTSILKESNAVHNQATETRNSLSERQRVRNNKLSKKIIRETATAIVDYNMIEDGDKVMVCLSGGKDSYTLLEVLRTLQTRAPIKFELLAVNLDQKQPGFPEHILPEYLSSIGVPFHIENQDTYSIVKRVIPEGKTTCSLCSRLRRGILYRVAEEFACNKIALGHHRDDILATFFLNLFYAAKLKSMPPKLVSDNGKHTVIRPLAYVAESDIIKYAEIQEFPIIPCNLCGSQENLKRQEINRMIRDWEKESPKKVWNTFKALSTVVPSHLMDRDLFDFASLKPNFQDNPEGDTAFDSDTFPDLEESQSSTEQIVQIFRKSHDSKN